MSSAVERKGDREALRWKRRHVLLHRRFEADDADFDETQQSRGGQRLGQRLDAESRLTICRTPGFDIGVSKCLGPDQASAVTDRDGDGGDVAFDHQRAEVITRPRGRVLEVGRGHEAVG
jgi:hypothetical protein